MREVLLVAVLSAAIVTVVEGTLISKTNSVIPSLAVDEVISDLASIGIGANDVQREEFEQELADITAAMAGNEEQVLDAFFALLPSILLSATVTIIVGFFSLLAYILMGISKSRLSLTGFCKGCPLLLFPFVGTAIWIALRSFVWVAFFNPISVFFNVAAVICGIVFLPRLLPALVLVMRDRSGVLASVRKSYEMTHGQWARMTFSLFIAFLVSGVSAYLLTLFSLVIGGLFVSLYLTLFLQYIVWQLTMAYNALFLAQLTETFPRMSIRKV